MLKILAVCKALMCPVPMLAASLVIARLMNLPLNKAFWWDSADMPDGRFLKTSGIEGF